MGIFFAHQWHNTQLIINSFWLFLSFCATASSVYIINDLLDLEYDQIHPTKKFRPIAAKLVNIKYAVFLAILLFLLGILFAFIVKSILAVFIIIVYFITNVLYSWYLKHLAIIDVLIIALGYILRILVGTDGIGISMSSWLLLCGMSIAMLLAFGKRFAEKLQQEESYQRKVLQAYSQNFLIIAITITASIFLVFYGLYTLDSQSIAIHGRKLILTYPWIVLGILRYLQLLSQNNSIIEDPASLFFRDIQLLLILAGWLLTFILVTNYGKLL